ncbi:hypothetical protein FQA39_LY13176 [Lamprigera yunnana]|nr:hypothetical protein FQA39_LY13176 [Lamprigera yunnana]
MKMNNELVPKSDVHQAQKDANQWKLKYEEIIKRVEYNQNQNIETVQMNLQNKDIQHDLEVLKNQCFGIENLIQFQGNKLKNLFDKWQNTVDIAQCSKLQNITNNTLNNVTSKNVFQNDYLVELLKENKSIKYEICSLKRQLLKISLKSVDNSERIYSKVETKTLETQTNSNTMEKVFDERNSNVIEKLQSTIEILEYEKKNLSLQFEQMCNKNFEECNELESKGTQLNEKCEETQRLKDTVCQLKSLRNEITLRLEETKQKMEQYRVQLQFTKLENENLHRREQK